MSNHLLSPFPLVLIFLMSPTIFAQSPAQAPVAPVTPVSQPPVTPVIPVAPVTPVTPLTPLTQPLVQAPTSSGPPDITAVLQKAGHFTIFIQLLKNTGTTILIHDSLNSSQGLTVFAPSDNAFGSLSTGALNSYSNQQKAALAKFHIISSVLSIPDFQTVTNPITTEAGNSIQYPMNVTESGNILNISTGIVNTTVTGTVFSDGQLAVYKVDQVLIPLYFFVTPAPAPGPATLKPMKKAPAPTGQSADASVTLSSAVRVIQRGLGVVCFGGSLVAGLVLRV